MSDPVTNFFYNVFVAPPPKWAQDIHDGVVGKPIPKPPCEVPEDLDRLLGDEFMGLAMNGEAQAALAKGKSCQKSKSWW